MQVSPRYEIKRRKQIQLPKKLTEKPAITKKALQRKLSQAVKRNKVEDKS